MVQRIAFLSLTLLLTFASVKAQPLVISGTELTNMQLADMNSDGLEDLVGISIGATANVLYFPRLVNGEFGPAVSILTNPFLYESGGITTGDLNNDGHLDMVVLLPMFISVYLNNGSGQLSHSFTNSISMTDTWLPDGISQEEICHPFKPLLSHRNGDAFPDLDFAVIRCLYNQPFSTSETLMFTLFGNGTGGFTSFYDWSFLYPVTSPSPDIIKRMEALDMNEDGTTELAFHSIVNSVSGPSLYAVRTYPSFSMPAYEMVTQQEQYQFISADVDGDNHQDIVILKEWSNSSNRFAWYMNDGNGVFSTENLLIDDSFECDDFDMTHIDGDGDQDIVGITNTNNVVIYKRENNGNYSSYDGLSEDSESYNSVLLVERLDGSGYDIIVSGSSTDLYRFECSPGNYPAPTGLSSIITGNQLVLSWDAIPLSVACRITGGPVSGPSTTIDIIENEPSSYTIPLGALNAGTSYQWKVRCACDLSPLIGGPYSPYSNFIIPPGIEENQDLAQKNILSSDTELMIFPNPSVDGIINIQTNKVISTLFVFDLLGKKVMEVQGLNNTQHSIDLNDNKGVFNLVIYDLEHQLIEQELILLE